MKKLLRILLVLVLLVLALLIGVGPRIIGGYTEDIYRQLVEDQNENSDSLRLVLRDYQPGWFSSQARIDLEILNPGLKQRAESLFGVGTRFQINDQIAHGPVPFANGVILPQLVNGKLRVEVLPGGGNPRSLIDTQYHLRLDGGLDGKLESPALTINTLDGGMLDLAPVSARFSSSADGSQFELSGHHGQILDHGKAELTLGSGDFALAIDSEQTHLLSNLTSLSFTDPQKGFLQLDQVVADYQLSNNQDNWDVALDLRAANLSGAFQATGFSAVLRADSINRESFQNASARARRQLIDPRLSPIAVVFGAILGELPGFLGPKPRLFIGPIRANVNGQQLAVDGQLGVLDGAIASNPSYAWRSLDGQIAANLPRPVVEWLVLQFNLGGGIPALVENGVLMPSASEQYLLDLSLLSGIVNLNGMRFEPDISGAIR